MKYASYCHLISSQKPFIFSSLNKAFLKGWFGIVCFHKLKVFLLIDSDEFSFKHCVISTVFPIN